MGWWMSLKIWHKCGIAVAVVYLAVFTLFYSMVIIYAPHGESGLGYLVAFMTIPWVGFLLAVGIGQGTLGVMFLTGLFAGIMNGVVAMTLVYLAMRFKRAN